MKSAKLTRLGDLMALARRAAELRLAGLTAEAAQADARRGELRAALMAPLDASALTEAGGVTAELDWRRGLAVQITAEERRSVDLAAAIQAASADLRKAFGRDRAAQRLVKEAVAAERRQTDRRAEDEVQVQRSGCK